MGKKSAFLLKRLLEKHLVLFCPLYLLHSLILSRLLWVFSQNEFYISKLIFCQNHFRLMTVVFVYPLSMLPGYVCYLPPLPLNSCRQAYRATLLLCINCEEPQGYNGEWPKKKCHQAGLGITEAKHKFCHKLDEIY